MSTTVQDRVERKRRAGLGRDAQTSPKPATRRRKPKMAAIPQQMSPAKLLPLAPSGAMPVTIADTTAPTMEKGISSQFSAPKNGVKATSTPTSARIPQTRLTICIAFSPAHSLDTRSCGLPVDPYSFLHCLPAFKTGQTPHRGSPESKRTC